MKKRRKSVLRISITIYIFVLLIGIIVTLASPAPARKDTASSEATAATSRPIPKSYRIDGVPVIEQMTLKSGCETYACTMLLQSLGFKINEVTFAEKYLICQPISYDAEINRYGPDMYSAFAGTPVEGYGIYAPAMAKSMNKFFKTQQSNMNATALEGVSLKQLCDDYVSNDIPVMVWATVNMQEPYEKAWWIVDYVDENARTKKGDTFAWLQNEHCLVLIGYDEDEYYFADSCAGDVSHFDKDLCQQRYEELFSQAIIVTENDE